MGNEDKSTAGSGRKLPTMNEDETRKFMAGLADGKLRASDLVPPTALLAVATAVLTATFLTDLNVASTVMGYVTGGFMFVLAALGLVQALQQPRIRQASAALFDELMDHLEATGHDQPGLLADHNPNAIPVEREEQGKTPESKERS